MQFCYYNNYNIKQPRYFCKACQRYWTAGGILRNVPIGAGRRKSKSSAVREQEKAATAAAAKQARAAGGSKNGPNPQAAAAMSGRAPAPGVSNGDTGQVQAQQQAGLMSGAGDLLPNTAMGGAYAEQLRFMMDPCGQLAAGGMGGGPLMGAGPMGGAGYDAVGFGGGFGPGGMMVPPHAMVGGGLGGTPRLADGSGAMLASAGSGLQSGGGGDTFSGPSASGHLGVQMSGEDRAREGGRRVRPKLEHGGGLDSGRAGSGAATSSGLTVHTGSGKLVGGGCVAGDGGIGGGGGDERHAEWAAAAQAAERQQAAALAAQMAAAQAQASMQQAAAMQVMLCRGLPLAASVQQDLPPSKCSLRLAVQVAACEAPGVQLTRCQTSKAGVTAC